MSEIRVNRVVDEAGTGAVELTEGATLPAGKTLSGSGTISITVANATNATTATNATNAAGLTGTPNITVNNVVGAAATFSGDVIVNGSLTYQDVANIDSVGMVTARKGVQVLADGMNVVGIVTVSEGTNLDGFKVEEGDIETTSLNGEFDFLLENGHIQKFTGSTGGNYQPDFKVSATKSLNSIMDVGDVVTCTLMVASSSHYLASGSIKIDDSTSNLDIDNVGGSAPSAANGSGYDIYSFTIQKTAATPAYHIVVNTLGAN